MEKVYLSNKTFLSDLCARALYHPRVHVVDKITKEEYDDWLTFANFTEYASIRYELKLYLRPMSSMTKEEKNELTEMTITSPNLETAAVLFRERHYEEEPHWRNDWAICSLPKVLNWFNAHHFDYRGLIEKGLAIEVTKDNNPYEKE